MEQQVITKLAEHGLVVLLLGGGCWVFLKMYLKEKAAHMRTAKEFRDHLKEEGDAKGEIIRQDTLVKSKMIEALNRKSRA